jgi:biotin carboxyl carrier protein
MRHDILTPDGEVHEVRLAPVKGGLVVEDSDLRFERAGDDTLWLAADAASDGGEEGKQLVHATKVKDTWWIHHDGRCWKLDLLEDGGGGAGGADAGLSAPMPGTILEVLVESGDEVVAGQALLVMEAMKMEHRITAPKEGIIETIHFQVGERCEQGDALITLADAT